VQSCDNFQNTLPFVTACVAVAIPHEGKKSHNQTKLPQIARRRLCSVDGLKGFEEAIKASFPKAEIQKCVVHQIRNSTKFVSYKDRKASVQI
jgi:hypothetical protein